MAKKKLTIELDADLYEATISRALRRHRYPELVENDKFDPEKEESKTNSRTKPNPQKPEAFAIEKITQEFEDQAVQEQGLQLNAEHQAKRIKQLKRS